MQFNTPDIEQAYTVSHAKHARVMHACSDEGSALKCIHYYCKQAYNNTLQISYSPGIRSTFYQHVHVHKPIYGLLKRFYDDPLPENMIYGEAEIASAPSICTL